ncbi:MAG: hypothetical protein ABJH05_01200 [Fulvivirga sp.]
MTLRFILTLLCLLQCAYSLKSQDLEAITKGKRVVGGSLGLTIVNDENPGFDPNDKTTLEERGFSVYPYAGKFIKDKILVGTSLFASVGDSKFIEDNSFLTRTRSKEYHNYGIGVFMRKYYPLVGKFGAFIQPDVLFTLRGNEIDRSVFDKTTGMLSTETPTRVEGFSINTGASLGLYVFIGEKFSLETNLGNLSFNYIREEDEGQSQVYRDSNLRLELINQMSFDKIIVFNYFF